MILSNTEIVKGIKEGLFTIDPLYAQDPSESPFNTSAVDLRLGNEILVPKGDVPFVMDLRKPGIARHLQNNSDKILITDEQGYTLKHGKFVLAKTIEKVSFPITEGKQCYSARVEGRSSLARCGILVHFTAPTIHAGFEGTITLEIINLGATDFLLSPNMHICQLIVEEVKGSPSDAPNQFKGQSDAAGMVNK